MSIHHGYHRPIFINYSMRRKLMFVIVNSYHLKIIFFFSSQCEASLVSICKLSAHELDMCSFSVSNYWCKLPHLPLDVHCDHHLAIHSVAVQSILPWCAHL